MFQKIMGVAALCLTLSIYVQGQDLVCGAIATNGSGNQRTAKIKITNQNKAVARPLRVYVELHSDVPFDNPIAQLSFTRAKLKGWRTRILRMQFTQFTFRAPFNMSHATKLVVLCDPKDEVKEKNEGNNVSSIALPH